MAGRAQLAFSDSDHAGTFSFGGRQWPVTVLNLPSVVESYKTLDDVNLVKTTDIGQVRCIDDGQVEAGSGRAEVTDCHGGGWCKLGALSRDSRRAGRCNAAAPAALLKQAHSIPLVQHCPSPAHSPPPQCPLPATQPQVLVVGGEGEPEAAAEAAAGEVRDGVTPPMRNARERIFRRPIDVSPQVVQKVEFDLLTILAVSDITAEPCLCKECCWGVGRQGVQGG